MWIRHRSGRLPPARLGSAQLMGKPTGPVGRSGTRNSDVGVDIGCMRHSSHRETSGAFRCVIRAPGTRLASLATVVVVTRQRRARAHNRCLPAQRQQLPLPVFDDEPREVLGLLGGCGTCP
jgi:hypothetical protein